MQGLTQFRRLAPYPSSLALGLLVGWLTPASLQRPAFFIAVACIIVFAFASQRFKAHSHWSEGKKIAVVLLAVVGLGSPETEIRAGPMPNLLVMSVLFSLGFMLTLYALPSAA